MASVQLEQVSKKFPTGVKVVSDLQLAVEDGELLVLVGPSGCGKTTTLRMIAGLETATAGCIRIGGREVTHVAPQARHVAMMFQSEALFPHLSVRNNLAFGLQIESQSWWRRWLPRSLPFHQTSTTEGEIEQRIIQTATWLGLADLLERKPHELSGGERRRVALGQAMIGRPDVLMLDEPLANLDAGLRVAMRAEIKRLQRQLKQTMIVVTHDQAEAMSLGDRIAVMEAGELLQTGQPLDVYHQPGNRKVASLLGSPTMNFLRGNVVHHEGQLWFKEGAWQARLSLDGPAEQAIPPVARNGQAVELGVRPENVQIAPAATGVAAPGSTVHSLAKIVMVESLGDSAILYLQRENDSKQDNIFTAKVKDCQSFELDQMVRVKFTRCQWFDLGTGNRIEDDDK